jgi:hypothetical protein
MTESSYLLVNVLWSINEAVIKRVVVNREWNAKSFFGVFSLLGMRCCNVVCGFDLAGRNRFKEGVYRVVGSGTLSIQ